MRPTREIVDDLIRVTRQLVATSADRENPEYRQLRRTAAVLELEYCDALREAGRREPKRLRSEAKRTLHIVRASDRPVP